ncbi:MAG: hypothetical protein DRJ34_03955 [Thermoprotei archaeon]|nr:MAG: hypothetical protein DRJ34_03955 [Thermoprotei archaeon]
MLAHILALFLKNYYINVEDLEFQGEGGLSNSKVFDKFAVIILYLEYKIRIYLYEKLRTKQKS